MSPAGEAKRRYLMANKQFIKPRRCRNSATGWGICKDVKECATLDCGDCACVPWEGQEDGM